MKHLIAIFILLGLFVTTFAQNDSIPKPPAPIEIDSNDVDKKKKFEISFGDEDDSKKIKTRLLMLDRGISTYLHEGSVNLPTNLDAMDANFLRSTNWSFHLIKQRVSLHKKNRVNLTYGLTLDFNKYVFNNDYTLQPEKTEVTFVDNVGVEFKKNQLNSTHIIAPLMLGFRLKPKNTKRAFTIKVGAYGGFLLASKTTQKLKGEKKVKVKDDFGLNKARYGITARAGYGVMNLYVNYSLSSLFKESEQGDFDLQPISFGISVIPF